MRCCFVVLAVVGIHVGCVAHGSYLTMRMEVNGSAAQEAVRIRAEGVVADVVESFNMQEDQNLAKRRAYSRDDDAYPFEITHSYEYLTSEHGTWAEVYLTVGIEKQTGDFAASIFHSAPLLKTDFATRLKQALVLELTREFPGAELEIEATRILHVLGP